MANYDGRGLVSTEWLAEHLDDPDLRVFDVTVHLRPATPGPYTIESGRADYEAGHVPGAAFLDLARDLSDPDARLPFTMPSLERLAAALGAAGVGPRSAGGRLFDDDADVGDAAVVDAARLPASTTPPCWTAASPNGRPRGGRWRPANVATRRRS